MKIYSVAASMLLAAGAFGTGLGVTHAANATSTSANQQTCADFHAWKHHKTPAGLDRTLTASEHAKWNPLGADVVVLYTDIRSGDRFDQPSDIKALTADCH